MIITGKPMLSEGGFAPPCLDPEAQIRYYYWHRIFSHRVHLGDWG